MSKITSEQLLNEIKSLLAPNDICVGFEVLVVTTTALPLANVPSGANRAIFQVETNSAAKAVRYREDGVDPTSSVGKYKQAGDEVEIIGAQSLKQFRVIQGDAGTTQLNILYYK